MLSGTHVFCACFLLGYFGSTLSHRRQHGISRDLDGVDWNSMLREAITSAKGSWDRHNVNRAYDRTKFSQFQRMGHRALNYLPGDREQKGFMMRRVINEVCARARVTPNVLAKNENFMREWNELNQNFCIADRDIDCAGISERYRTFDGSCNNLNNPLWGVAGTPLRRRLPALYADGIDSPRRARDGSSLPSARAISNIALSVSDNGQDVDDDKLTVLHMTFGQFLDHDLDLAPMTVEQNPECCTIQQDQWCYGDNPVPSSACDRRDCFQIKIPEGDRRFGDRPNMCMRVVRSQAAICRDNCEPCLRQQPNALTSFIDASMVYGSSETQAKNLRVNDGKGAKLRTNPDFDSMGEFLPANPDNSTCSIVTDTEYCGLQGDTRGNEVSTLFGTHTTFLREHNRMVDNLRTHHPEWDDETLYQEARRIMAAVIQWITYSEYVPLVIGKRGMKKFIFSKPNRYDPSVDPSITNVFATAAFRFGHSQVNNFIKRLTTDFQEEASFDLRDNFFMRNQPALEGTKVSGMHRWQHTDKTAKTNRKFDNGVRNFLFENFDLPALNIQRGRDHGLPTYNAYRRLCRLPILRRTRNRAGRANHDITAFRKLREAYGSQFPREVDVYAGGISELPVGRGNGIVGPLFQCLIGRDFDEVRRGDRFYFEFTFPEEQQRAIKRITLAKIICENSNAPDDQNFVQKRVFESCCECPGRRDAPYGPGSNRNCKCDNERVLCSSLPDIDFSVF